jgi:hypothetical protein
MKEQITIGFKGRIIQLGIVSFWVLFWLLNVADKLIGEPGFLFVGTDRFALFFKFFGSLGIESIPLPLVALAITTVIEISALILSGATLLYLLRQNDEKARNFFFWGTFAGLILFTFFIIGDQIFGDRVEVLEHSLFWVILIISWAAYTYLPKQETAEGAQYEFTKEALFAAAVVIAISSMLIVGVQSISGIQSTERLKTIEPVYIGNDIYSFEAPFIATGKVWQESLVKFLREYSDLRIVNIYTVPKEFGRAKATNVVIWVLTAPIK